MWYLMILKICYMGISHCHRALNSENLDIDNVTKILCLYPRYNFLILFHLPAILPWFISYSFKIAIKIINYLYISQIMMNLTERKSLPMKRLRDYFQGLEYSDPSCLLELQELVEMSWNEDWWRWNQKDTRQLFHVCEV